MSPSAFDEYLRKLQVSCSRKHSVATDEISEVDTGITLFELIDAYFYQKSHGLIDDAFYTAFHIGIFSATHGQNEAKLKDHFHRLKMREEIQRHHSAVNDKFESEILIPAHERWAAGETADHSEMAEYLERKPDWPRSAIMRRADFKNLARKFGRLKGVKGYRKKK